MNDFNGLKPIFKEAYAKKKKGENVSKFKKTKKDLLAQWKLVKALNKK